MLDWIMEPWPWYVAGPMIGLTVPLLMILTGKGFGISSSFRHACAACAGPDTSVEFLKYDWKKDKWNLFFAVGIALGGFIAVHLLGGTSVPLLAPDAYSMEGAFRLIIGGFLVGFGSRYAGGCTSGHTIMGLSSLQMASLYAVLSFFAGGVITAYIVSMLLG